MAFYDWLLFLHVATAFALVAALVVFWIIAVAGRNGPAQRVTPFVQHREAGEHPRRRRDDRDAHLRDLACDRLRRLKVWDGWVLLAIALWVVSAGTGQRGGQTYAEAQKLAAQLAADGRGDEPSAELRVRLQDRRAMWLNIVSSAAVLAILIVMIYKPGA